MGILAPIQVVSSGVAAGRGPRGGSPWSRHIVRRSLGLLRCLVSLLMAISWAAPASAAKAVNDSGLSHERFENRNLESKLGSNPARPSGEFDIRKGQVRTGGRAQALLRWQGVRALVDQQELSLDFVDTQLRPLQGSLPYYQISLDPRGRRLLLSFPGLGSAVDESTFRREVARLKLVGVPWRAAGVRVDPADSTLVIWLEIAEAPSTSEALEATLRIREVASGLRIAWNPSGASLRTLEKSQNGQIQNGKIQN